MAMLFVAFPAFAQDLTIDLLPGVVQNRNFDQKGRWHRQWVRTLPPKQDPYLMVVHGPDAWLDQAGREQTPAQVAAANEPHLRVLVAALRQRGLLAEDDPLFTATCLVATLRPVAAHRAGPPSRYSRLWQGWEVLADAVHADTLSTAFTAVQALQTLGIPVHLARYPAGGTGSTTTSDAPTPEVFGVWLSREDAGGSSGSSGADWTRNVDGGYLVPLVRAVWPGELEEPITTWTWDEMLADGWQPGGSLPSTTPTDPRTPTTPRPSRDTDTDTEAGPTSTQPDICAQARALGLECLPGQQEDGTLYVISAVLLALLGLLGWSSWRTRQQRLARQQTRRAERARRKF